LPVTRIGTPVRPCDGAAKESGLRENCTSRLSERTEEGLRLDLLRLYTDDRRAAKRARREGPGPVGMTFVQGEVGVR
jgi:hypothetical protein